MFKKRVSSRAQPKKWILDFTIATNIDVEYIAHLNIDRSQESLILFLELFLVKDLNCNDTLVRHLTVSRWCEEDIVLFLSVRGTGCVRSRLIIENQQERPRYTSKLSFQYGFNVFFMTVVVLVWSPSTVTTAKGSGRPR